MAGAFQRPETTNPANQMVERDFRLVAGAVREILALRRGIQAIWRGSVWRTDPCTSGPCCPAAEPSA